MDENMIQPFEFTNEEAKTQFYKIPVDNYIFTEKESILKTTKGAIIIPISRYYGLDDNTVDYFVMSSKSKKCYNSAEVRNHICRYINFFENFYDYDKEYIAILYNMKLFIDREPSYGDRAFMYDINRYILSPSIKAKVEKMVEDNYIIDLRYRNNQNQALQYDNTHGKILMCISIFMNMVIPLAMHFIYMRNVEVVDDFLKELFDPIIYLYADTANIFNKLYETATSSVKNNSARNSVIWGKQDIRGKDVYTHSDDSLDSIILNIMPKYVFNQHMVNFNFSSIRKNITFQVTDIGYEYNFIPLSSSKRDADSNSEFDKYESYLIMQNEGKYLLNKVNSDQVCKMIEERFGPYNPDEVEYYRKQLRVNGETSIQHFQKQLVLYLFYKYFGDTLSPKGINEDSYIKLIITARNILENENLLIMPEIVCGKVNKYVSRNTVNKTVMQYIESSAYYPDLVHKYRNQSIIKHIISIIGSVLASDITMINYEEQDYTGKKVPINWALLADEVVIYALLI